jgi:segregation and condensation protein A
MYQVRTEKFEGPLELLAELIEKQKLDITEFSLAAVADEYLDFIRQNDAIHLEHLAEFLSVASKLILIKSRALLPMLKFSEEEEKEIKDLEQQLEEYKKYKEISIQLGKIANSGKICYSRGGYIGINSVFYPPADINAYDLKKYYLAVLSEIPVIEELQQEIVSDVVTLEERINHLESMLRAKVQSSFHEIVANAEEKIDVIVSFLAVLEMVKQRVIEVEQDSIFHDITLRIKEY